MIDVQCSSISATRRRWNLFTGAVILYTFFAALFLVLKVYLR